MDIAKRSSCGRIFIKFVSELSSAINLQSKFSLSDQCNNLEKGFVSFDVKLPECKTFSVLSGHQDSLD